MHFIDHLIMFILGVVLPLRSWQSAQAGDLREMRFDSRSKKMLYYSNGGLLWVLALVVVAVWWFSGRDLATLGLSFTPWHFSFLGWGILGIFGALYFTDLFMEVGSQRGRRQTGEEMRRDLSFLPANWREYGHYMFLAVSAGICEEIVFRGYFIRYFQVVLGQESLLLVGLSLLLPALMFGISHLYQGWEAVVKIVSMALMFGAFFVLTGTLWPLIVFHAVIDLLGGLVSVYLIGRHSEAP